MLTLSETWFTRLYKAVLTVVALRLGSPAPVRPLPVQAWLPALFFYAHGSRCAPLAPVTQPREFCKDLL